MVCLILNLMSKNVWPNCLKCLLINSDSQFNYILYSKNITYLATNLSQNDHHKCSLHRAILLVAITLFH